MLGGSKPKRLRFLERLRGPRSWKVFRRLGNVACRVLGAIWEPFGGLWGPLGGSWQPLGGFLEPLGRHIGVLEGPQIMCSWRLLDASWSLLERFWDLLERSWEPLGDILGIYVGDFGLILELGKHLTKRFSGILTNR